MKVACIIPARYSSSRFPGKPLADIQGKPMIWWVYQQALKVDSFSSVSVATDDARISEECEKLGVKVVMTGSHHATGTDRVGEAASYIKADVYVNVQGDEPLLSPETIVKAIEPFRGDGDVGVVNLMTEIKRRPELVDSTVPKIVVNGESEAVYLSRLPIPYPKESEGLRYFKQVCVYGFTPQALDFFCNTAKGPAERAEDIELLRFIENRVPVKMVEVPSDCVSVDTPSDLELARKMIKEQGI